MNEKVILISIDGMRPDGFENCGHPFAAVMKKEASFSLDARTVLPSVTLPCHMSLFHSVDPSRHGVVTNTWSPQVRPIPGLFEALSSRGKSCAMYYGWEPLRDVARPGSLRYAGFIDRYEYDHTDAMLTDLAIARIKESAPDLVFLYLVETDDKGGHDHGWMTPEYLRYLHDAVDCTERVWNACGEEYSVIVTADHGGHDRSHGSDRPEDMTIPVFLMGHAFPRGKRLYGVSILDVAPTILALFGIPAPREWEGKSLLEGRF